MGKDRMIINREVGKIIYDALNTCINKSGSYARAYPDKYYLWIPEFYMPYLAEHLHSLFVIDVTKDLTIYRGFKIMPGYENKIVLGLKNAPLYGSEEMMFVELENLVIEKA